MVDRAVTDVIVVEVAYAERGRQFLRRVELAIGATVADAIAASGLEREWSIDTNALAVGIWSSEAARDRRVESGDRIELYRPLTADPKESRRRRAERNPLKGN